MQASKFNPNPDHKVGDLFTFFECMGYFLKIEMNGNYMECVLQNHLIENAKIKSIKYCLRKRQRLIDLCEKLF